MPIDLEDLTEYSREKLFTLERSAFQIIPDNFEEAMAVNYEIDFDLSEYRRSYYTTLDFFSDIGGLQSILITFFSVLLSVINQNRIGNFLAFNLFMIAPEKDKNIVF